MSAPVSAAKTTKTRKVRREVPLSEITDPVKKIGVFYKRRAKDPLHYTYTPEGDLRVQGLEGVTEETIAMSPFTSLRPEERNEIEEQQMTKLAEIETMYEDALLKLRNAMNLYLTEGEERARDVVIANQMVQDLSLQRTAIAYPSRWIVDEHNPTVSEVIFSQPYEKRKIGYDVYLYKRQPMKTLDEWGHYRSNEELAAFTGENQTGGGAPPIFITDVEDKETGYLHPTHPREFVFMETRYFCPYQAFVGEVLNEKGDEESKNLRKQILGTRSARTIRNLAETDTEKYGNPQRLYEAILMALYEEHPDLRAKLLATGSAKFHVMDKDIGGHPYGEALTNVRSYLREAAEEEEKAPKIVKESVISTEQQKQDRKGAIINNFRKRNF